MRYQNGIALIAAASLVGAACSRPEPAPPAAESSAADTAAADLQRKRNEEVAQLDGRVADLGRRWTDMEGKLAARSATVTPAMRAEIKEDMENVRQAVADLRTTEPTNWWERHERAMERTATDIEADVRRLAKGKPAASSAATDTSAPTAPFESRRDRLVTQLRARVEAMEAQLKGVRASGTQETELDDTRARVEKLKDDIDRLGRASPDDWWDLSTERVREYVDRLDASIRRMDDNKG
jgi:hypothetical protein